MAKGFKTGGKDFEPGHQSQGGRPPLLPAIKELRKLSTEQIKEVADLLCNCTIEEMEKMLENKNMSVLQGMLVSVFYRVIKSGDASQLDTILNRLIGKVSTPVEVKTGSVHSQLLELKKKFELVG